MMALSGIKAVQFACVTYHVIGDSPGQYAVPEASFRSQMDHLSSGGYVVEGFDGLERRLVAGSSFSPRYIVLTIDDGHESAMRAAELLSLYRYSATFFVTRNRCLQKPKYVREHHLRTLRAAGFSLGTHGTTHKKLTFMPRNQCASELTGSKEWLEDLLGEEVRYMAAPGGYINRPIMRLAWGAGYSLIGTCREWLNSSARMNLPCAVNRVNIRPHFSIRTITRLIEGSASFYLCRQLRTAMLALPKQVLR